MNWHTAVSYEDDQAIVAVRGEIDMVSETQLREAVERALHHEPAPARITVDLAEVSFLDSAGIRALLVSHSRAAERGTELRVRDPQPTVASVLQVTRVNDLLGLPLPAAPQRPSRHR